MDPFIKLHVGELNNLNIDKVKDILNDDIDDKYLNPRGFQGNSNPEIAQNTFDLRKVIKLSEILRGLSYEGSE